MMKDSTRQNRAFDTVGTVAEYLITGIIVVMTVVSTLRMLGILS